MLGFIIPGLSVKTGTQALYHGVDNDYPRPGLRLSRGRCALRMNGADDDAPSDEDVAPSDTAVVTEVMLSKEDLIGKILELAALTDRGQTASRVQKTMMEEYVAQLDGMNPTESPVDSSLIDGMWNLMYTSTKLFKTNPFLLAAATPILSVGQIQQTIFLDGAEIRTEVDVKAFPEISGKLVTAGRVTPVGPERIEVTVEKVTIRGGSILDKIDLGGISFDVPVEQIYQQLKGSVPETFFDTSYLDDKIRISRSKAGETYIFCRQT